MQHRQTVQMYRTLDVGDCGISCPFFPHRLLACHLHFYDIYMVLISTFETQDPFNLRNFTLDIEVRHC